MAIKNLSQLASFYQKRFGFKPTLINESIHPETQLIITIPCHNEPDLITTLESLLACEPNTKPIEILIGINAGEHVSNTIKEQNLNTYRIFQDWKSKNLNRFGLLSFHAFCINDLPQKHAGAGMARKVVMDEALYRFATIDLDGGIVCLDADCYVSSNYLKILEESFHQNPSIKSAAIYFEHPYQEETNQNLKQGIINYELYLRYYSQGLKYAGFPYHFHTVGSSMAVRASTYALTGGMNRRKAGEDFYFMHKVMPQGKVLEINHATVYPSCRLSDRVPFGTGRAQHEWLKNEERVFMAYDPKTFSDLKSFLDKIPTLYQKTGDKILFDNLPKSVVSFLENQQFLTVWEKLKRETNSYETFHTRFFHWLDGFRILKYVHHARDHFFSNIPIKEAATFLLKKVYILQEENLDEIALLTLYRQLDKKELHIQLLKKANN